MKRDERRTYLQQYGRTASYLAGIKRRYGWAAGKGHVKRSVSFWAGCGDISSPTLAADVDAYLDSVGC